MPLTVEMLQDELFALPDADREKLAVSLFESLRPYSSAPIEEDADDAQLSAEMRRRADEIRMGLVETIPYEEARRRIRAITRTG